MTNIQQVFGFQKISKEIRYMIYDSSSKLKDLAQTCKYMNNDLYRYVENRYELELKKEYIKLNMVTSYSKEYIEKILGANKCCYIKISVCKDILNKIVNIYISNVPSNVLKIYVPGIGGIIDIQILNITSNNVIQRFNRKKVKVCMTPPYKGYILNHYQKEKDLLCINIGGSETINLEITECFLSDVFYNFDLIFKKMTIAEFTMMDKSPISSKEIYKLIEII